ncbi:hypothetical protein Ahy_Scaffold4g107728 [Arachis hypogaea]|uniref:DUF223 domain-containing protein n=1 Tax=Arachis hypogaea TaxID=3818 RepID=A0A444WQ95_ARAHY|nr:hypothetical protein Ahy_Scaffold4g107728 [Arachis hypogaea]
MVCLDKDEGKNMSQLRRILCLNLYFGVGFNASNFRTKHHEYVVNLKRRTDVHILSESSSIPRYRFNFMNFDTLNALGFDYTYLIDVIGYVVGIETEKILKKMTILLNTMLLN